MPNDIFLSHIIYVYGIYKRICMIYAYMLVLIVTIHEQYYIMLDFCFLLSNEFKSF